MTDLVGKTFGEFRLIEPIGSGGMANVYLAEQVTLKRPAAVKILKPALMAASAERVVARFRQEAMTAAGVSHPNIVQVYTIGEENGYHFIAQEYVKGKDLATILRAHGPPEIGPCLHVIKQIATALEASGAAGIVHRDIKPDNILVDKKGVVKVADFGLAQLQENPDTGGLTKEGSTLGTPLYMSPEQVRGETLDIRSDIYSFGVTCYQLFCGRTPFSGTSATGIAVQHITTKPPPLSEEREGLPEVICQMVHCMMAKKADERYQTPSDILQDVKTLQAALKQKRSLDLVRLPVLSGIIREANSESGETGDQSSAASPFAAYAKATPVNTMDSFEELDVVALSDRKRASQKKQAKLMLGDRAWVTLPSWEVADDDEGLVRRRRPEFEEMDLTPMVDVTFLLLIFFMITAAFDLQKSFDVSSATSEESAVETVVEDADDSAVKVEIAADNRVYIEDQVGQTLDEITEILTALRSAREEVELQILIDPESRHEMRIRVNDGATQAGFHRIRSAFGAVR